MHLESIKYQVQHYFDGIEVTLLISDDGSKDKTIDLCQKWLEKNRKIFHDVMILGDGINRGTCGNILIAFKYLKSDSFFLLAGDDIYGFKSIKKVISNLEQYEIVTGPCLAFYENSESSYSIENDYNKYKTNISNGLCPNFMQRAFTIAGCLTEAPSTTFRRELLDNEVLDFVGQFKLIEDQPMIYQFFKKNKIRMKYLDYSYIMYRINPNSISHTNNTSIKSVVTGDLKKLCNYYFSNESNLLYKYIALLRMQVINGKRWVAFLFPTNHYLVVRQKVCSKKIKQYYKKAIVNTAARSLAHLKTLDKYTKEFLKNIE